MKLIKNKVVLPIVSLIMAISMVFSFAGCTDKSWCMKNSLTTLPMGVYIYNMFMAYNQLYSNMYSSLSSSSSGSLSQYSSLSVLNQTVGGKSASDWIKETAVTNTKNILAADTKMNELNLSLTDEELQAAKDAGNSNWSSYGATLKKYGISRDSYDIATGIYDAKKDKIAAATGLSTTELTDENLKANAKADYEERLAEAEAAEQEQASSEADTASSDTDTASSEVDTSDEAVKDYFLNNYISYSYMTKKFATDSTSSSGLDSEADVNEQFTRYQGYINSKEYTMETLRDRYQSGENLTSDPLVTGVNRLSDITDLPEDVKSNLSTLDNGVAKAVVSGDTYYLIYKDDINNQLSKLDDPTFKAKVVSAMQGKTTTTTSTDSSSTTTSTETQEFDYTSSNDIYELLKQTAEESTDIVINYSAIELYQPSMFESSTSSKKSS